MLENVLSITSVKTTGGEGGDPCLIYSVLRSSCSQDPFTESIEKTLNLPTRAQMATALYFDIVNP